MIVVLGAVAARALVATTANDSPGTKSPTESGGSTGRPALPSLSIPTELPSGLPSNLLPTELPSGLPSELPSGLESLFAAPAGDELPYCMLTATDCFDADAARPGQAAKRSCRSPHDAEVVKVAELEGTYTNDTAHKEAASELCERTLERRAAQQPAGTVRGILVQYPDPASDRLGLDKVTCSLAAESGSGDRELTGPLS